MPTSMFRPRSWLVSIMSKSPWRSLLARSLGSIAVAMLSTGLTALIINAAGWALGPTFTSGVTPLGGLLGANAIGANLGTIVAFVPWGAHQDGQNASESEATMRSSSSTDH